jgi:hypothetical protein
MKTMDVLTMVIGGMVDGMVRGEQRFQMAMRLKDSTNTTSAMDTESTLGKTDASTKATLKKTSVMER